MDLNKFTSDLLDTVVQASKGLVIQEALVELLPQLQQKVERITLDSEEAACYLGISEQTLRNMCREKQIPHTRAKTKYLFRKKSLDEWMSLQEAENYAGIKPIKEGEVESGQARQ